MLDQKSVVSERRVYFVVDASGDHALQFTHLGRGEDDVGRNADDDRAGRDPTQGGRYPANELFALRVRGESMIEAGILSGDIIIVHRTPAAQNGEIVVALVEDEATVKRFYKENGHYRLQPENSTMEPIIVDSVLILGKVVALLREY